MIINGDFSQNKPSKERTLLKIIKYVHNPVILIERNVKTPYNLVTIFIEMNESEKN